MIDLVELHKSDLKDLHLIMKNPKVARFLPEQSYESVEMVVELFDLLFAAIRDEKGYAWKIVDKNIVPFRTIGLVDVLLIEPEKSMGSLAYILSESYWGKGLGTAVLKTIISWAFFQIGLKKLMAPVVRRNVGSTKVLKRSGFSLVKQRKRTVNFDGKPDIVEIYELSNPDL